MSRLQVDLLDLKYLFHILTTLTVLLHFCDSLGDNTAACEQINACECVFSDGDGIDLSKLTSNLPSNWLNISNDKAKFYYHPCSNLAVPGENECSDPGAALCLYNKTSHNYILLGKAEEAKFLSQKGDTEVVYLQYAHNNITSTILLSCVLGTTTTLEISSTGNLPNDYKLTLHSPMACPIKITAGTDGDDNSLSTGSVLVILFFTFFALYFIVGALVLRFTRGAEGKELIPNFDFWSGLPSLCRDGVLFAMSGCSSVRTYDSI